MRPTIPVQELQSLPAGRSAGRAVALGVDAVVGLPTAWPPCNGEDEPASAVPRKPPETRVRSPTPQAPLPARIARLRNRTTPFWLGGDGVACRILFAKCQGLFSQLRKLTPQTSARLLHDLKKNGRGKPFTARSFRVNWPANGWNRHVGQMARSARIPATASHGCTPMKAASTLGADQHFCRSRNGSPFIGRIRLWRRAHELSRTLFLNFERGMRGIYQLRREALASGARRI